MLRRVLVLGVILAGLLAGTARAAPFTPELEADYAAALMWWGVSSPPQCASVTRALLADDLGETDGVEAAARATQPLPGETEVACTLDVYANKLTTGCPEEMVLRHEVGHLLGYGHSEDANSIMYSSLDLAVWCPADAAAIEAERRKFWAEERHRHEREARQKRRHHRRLKHLQG